MFAPLDKDGKPTTFLEYRTSTSTFLIPNYGFHVRLHDWDYATVDDDQDMPRAHNVKIKEKFDKVCASAVDPTAVWTPRLPLARAYVYHTEHRFDSSIFTDRITKRSCAAWRARGCIGYTWKTSVFLRSDHDAIRGNCPEACDSQVATVDFTVATAMHTWTTALSDDEVFADSHDHDCAFWAQPQRYSCDRAQCKSGYSRSSQERYCRCCQSHLTRARLAPREHHVSGLAGVC